MLSKLLFLLTLKIDWYLLNDLLTDLFNKLPLETQQLTYYLYFFTKL